MAIKLSGRSIQTHALLPKGHCGENKRHGFLEEYIEREEIGFPPLSQGMAPRNRRGIFGSGTPERKCRDILFLMLEFSVTLCLKPGTPGGWLNLPYAKRKAGGRPSYRLGPMGF
jgi:hypothetical protein